MIKDITLDWRKDLGLDEVARTLLIRHGYDAKMSLEEMIKEVEKEGQQLVHTTYRANNSTVPRFHNTLYYCYMLYDYDGHEMDREEVLVRVHVL